jgi:hypothetical protein
MRQSCPFAADQAALTTVPPGLVIIACPPGLSATVSVTPFVVTWTGWPTISDPGVHAGWATAAAQSPAAAIPTITRATNKLFMMLISSWSE